jgi:hypothetical protein
MARGRWRVRRQHGEASSLAHLAVRLVDEPAGADEKFFCTDLPDLDDASLIRERIKLVLGLSMTPRPSPWAEQRLQLVQAEIRARRCRREVAHE